MVNSFQLISDIGLGRSKTNYKKARSYRTIRALEALLASFIYLSFFSVTSFAMEEDEERTVRIRGNVVAISGSEVNDQSVFVHGKTLIHEGKILSTGVNGTAFVKATGATVITGQVEASGDIGIYAKSIDHQGTVKSAQGTVVLSTRVQSEIQGDVMMGAGSEVSGQEVYVEGRSVQHYGNIRGQVITIRSGTLQNLGKFKN